LRHCAGPFGRCGKSHQTRSGHTSDLLSLGKGQTPWPPMPLEAVKAGFSESSDSHFKLPARSRAVSLGRKLAKCKKVLRAARQRSDEKRLGSCASPLAVSCAVTRLGYSTSAAICSKTRVCTGSSPCIQIADEFYVFWHAGEFGGMVMPKVAL